MSSDKFGGVVVGIEGDKWAVSKAIVVIGPDSAPEVPPTFRRPRSSRLRDWEFSSGSAALTGLLDRAPRNPGLKPWAITCRPFRAPEVRGGDGR